MSISTESAQRDKLDDILMILQGRYNLGHQHHKARTEAIDAILALRNAAPSRLTADREKIARAIHDGLGGDGWAYTYYGGDEWNDMRGGLLSAADEVIALIEAVTPSPSTAITGEPVAWPKPISTAPTDGTVFIAHQNDDIYKCAWREEEPDEGPPRSGWYDFANKSFEDPTHWQPMEVATPPAAAPDQGVREALAEALWREEAADIAGIRKVRHPTLFADQSETTRAKWFKFADAALAALSRPAPDAAGSEWRTLVETTVAELQFNRDQGHAPDATTIQRLQALVSRHERGSPAA